MAKTPLSPEAVARIRPRLLGWYRLHRRDLPWRRTPSPYAVWVSEVMLQQTRVAVVIERYKRFLERFPTLLALALAPEQEVLAEWSGLGYYRRARMLHKAAIFVAGERGGNLPRTAGELRKLPGIGPYTAAAIASIAFGEAVAVVDGNVERVLCRLAGWGFGGQSAASAVKRKIAAAAQLLVDPADPGDFNQAVMELGATICLPQNPLCRVCPIAGDCKLQGEHRTSPRARIVSRQAACALAVRTSPTPGQLSREVLLEQRSEEQTVMPGLWELPPLADAEFPESELRMTVRHAIMNVNYYVRVRTVFEDDIDEMAQGDGVRLWVALNHAPQLPLTGLARKILTRARLIPVPLQST